MARPEWQSARRIVVKIGSALLTDQATGTVKADWLAAIGDDVAALRREGRDVILVSSGAIALGRRTLRLPKGGLKLEEAQAAAAVGQIALAHAYQTIFWDRGLTAAQVLVTPGDTEERRRYLNARNTMEMLLKLQAIPVVNENDTVATSEIRYGDNDRLAARVATMMTADCLVLLSDVDGLYTASPHQNPEAQRLDSITAITPEIEAMAGDAASELSRGGMKTKLAAAKIAVAAGTHMVIASGKGLHPLRALTEGAPCTWFLDASNPVAARKRWIAGSLTPTGAVVVDDGAKHAIQGGASLLPAGVVTVSGTFERGEAVLIRDRAGRELGRGLIAYRSADAARIAGRNSLEIEAALGYSGRTALIHRDDMALHRDLKDPSNGSRHDPDLDSP